MHFRFGDFVSTFSPRRTSDPQADLNHLLKKVNSLLFNLKISFPLLSCNRVKHEPKLVGYDSCGTHYQNRAVRFDEGHRCFRSVQGEEHSVAVIMRSTGSVIAILSIAIMGPTPVGVHHSFARTEQQPRMCPDQHSVQSSHG
jgi:hypothetical protein